MPDYMEGRVYVLREEDKKEHGKLLDVVAECFGIDFLSSVGGNPLQELWHRNDALATNELLNLGSALKILRKDDPTWLAAQVDIIKSGSSNNRFGAIFEIAALGLFDRSRSKVTPAKDSNPGFDATIEMRDSEKSRFMLSLKNHGKSKNEQQFHENANQLDTEFQRCLIENHLSGIEIRILSPVPLSSQAQWDALSDDIRDIVDVISKKSKSKKHARSNCAIVYKSMSPEFYPLGERNLSSQLFVAAPFHKNEQDNFLDSIRKGCDNLVSHTKELQEDIGRVIHAAIVRDSIYFKMSRMGTMVFSGRSFINDYIVSTSCNNGYKSRYVYNCALCASYCRATFPKVEQARSGAKTTSQHDLIDWHDYF